jgi:hypothetical protein
MMGWLSRAATTIFAGRREKGSADGASVSGAPDAPAIRLEVLSDPTTHTKAERALRLLRDRSQVLEQQFCSACTTLGDLNDRGRSLVTGAERLVDIASGKRSGIQVLLEGMSLVEPPLAFLSQYRERFEASRMLERLVEDQARIDECLRTEADINRVMEPLRTVNTLFKVVAAPLGEQVQAIFASLVEELGALLEGSDALVGTRFDELERVREVFRAMIDGMVAQQAHWTELAKQRAAMEATLRELEGQLVANAQRDTKIGAASRSIAQAIEQVVTGLQWQDIINQKLDHSSKAITGLIERLRAGTVEPAAVNRAARVEWAQIQVAQRELGEAERAIVEGIGHVRDILSQSDSSAVMLGEFELLTTSSTGMVQLLLESVDSIERQLESALTTSNDSMTTIRRIGESAAALTGAVRELSERTLLVGLNAQVQACKVQQGAGLGVLSARTSDISVEVAGIGDRVARKLDEIVCDLRDCAGIFAELLAQAQDHRGSFHEGREKVETCLHGVRDEALQLVQHTGEAIEEIGRIGAAALDIAHFNETMAPAFAALLDALDTLIVASGGHEARFEGQDASLEQTLESYTMESERKVFAAVGNAGAGAAAAVAHETSIELFGDEPPSAPTGPNAQSAQPASGGRKLDENIELF